jgi:hypothetical protein
VGAVAAGAAGFSTTALPLRSSRIGALIFVLACPAQSKCPTWSISAVVPKSLDREAKKGRGQVGLRGLLSVGRMGA